MDREQRISNLTEQLALAESTHPGISPDNSALRAQVIRLQGMIQSASDGENRANANVQRLNQELANADQKISSLRNRFGNLNL